MRESEKIFWSKLVQSFGGITVGAVGRYSVQVWEIP